MNPAVTALPWRLGTSVALHRDIKISQFSAVNYPDFTAEMELCFESRCNGLTMET